MPNFNNWLESSSRLSSGGNRVRLVAQRIAQEPTTITIVSRVAGSPPADQVVRLEQASGNGSTLDEREGTNLSVSLDTVMVLGYKNHPTIANTDLKRGDRFKVAGRAVIYEVVNVVETMTDRLLASARVRA